MSFQSFRDSTFHSAPKSQCHHYVDSFSTKKSYQKSSTKLKLTKSAKTPIFAHRPTVQLSTMLQAWYHATIVIVWSTILKWFLRMMLSISSLLSDRVVTWSRTQWMICANRWPASSLKKPRIGRVYENIRHKIGLFVTFRLLCVGVDECDVLDSTLLFFQLAHRHTLVNPAIIQVQKRSIVTDSWTIYCFATFSFSLEWQYLVEIYECW